MGGKNLDPTTHAHAQEEFWGTIVSYENSFKFRVEDYSHPLYKATSPHPHKYNLKF